MLWSFQCGKTFSNRARLDRSSSVSSVEMPHSGSAAGFVSTLISSSPRRAERWDHREMTVEGGLATDYWKRYYEPEEVDELLASSSVSGLSSGKIPIHLRLYEQPRPAPTVVMAHGVFLYGLITGRLQLPFFRAGFNVVQFDLPGMGQSGGPRAACTLDDMIRAWGDVLDFAREGFGERLNVMGIAEDGVMGYYAAANRPDVRALSVHTLFEYGDLGGVDWIGSAP